MLYDVIGNWYCYCEGEDVCPKIFMAGEMTWVYSDALKATEG